MDENDQGPTVEEIRMRLLHLAISVASPGTHHSDIVKAAKAFEDYLEEETKAEKEEDGTETNPSRLN